MSSGEMASARIVRIRVPDGGARAGVLIGDPIDVLAETDPLAVLMARKLADPIDAMKLSKAHLLTPLIPPDTWAAGVTYERSREARLQESQAADVYDLVYEAERPELFLKDAAGRRTVGPGEPIGNDVSSRDIEGADPLYLPRACAAR